MCRYGQCDYAGPNLNYMMCNFEIQIKRTSTRENSLTLGDFRKHSVSVNLNTVCIVVSTLHLNTVCIVGAVPQKYTMKDNKFANVTNRVLFYE